MRENLELDNIDLEIWGALNFKECDSLVDKFEEYQLNEIILNKEFKDEIWILNNEVDKISINFNMNRNDLLKISLDELKDALKYYVLILLTRDVIRTIQFKINIIKEFLIQFDYCNENYIEKCEKYWGIKRKEKDGLLTIIEFLDFYKFENSSIYILKLEEIYENIEDNEINQRTLVSMNTIFKFDNIINKTIKNREALKRYYIIVLWWKISTIIPIRTTEFTLLKYDCIIRNKGNIYLKIYRSDLKGKKVVKKHKIDKDYKEYILPISNEIEKLIEEYKILVEEQYKEYGMEISNRRFLFSRKIYFLNYIIKQKSVEEIRKVEENHITRYMFVQLLKTFYKSIINEKYGFIVVEKKKKDLKENEIEKLNLMDTRHIAFINLILNDINPILIKEIAGHSKVSSSYHYFSRIEEYLESRTYNIVRRQNYRDIDEINIQTVGVNIRKKLLLNKYEYNGKKVKYGKCFSNQENFEACLEVNGICLNCDFFEINNENINELINEIVKNRAEIKRIINMLINITKVYKDTNEDYELYSRYIKKITLLDRNIQNAMLKYGEVIINGEK